MKVMLDLETLSTAPNARVISLGIAKFDDHVILETVGWALDLNKTHGHIDPATCKWWMDQSAPAKDFSFNGKCDPVVAANDLKKALVGCTELWANDPDFDVVIVKNWYEGLHPSMGRWPVSFRLNRSYRTIMALAKEAQIDYSSAYTNNFIAHNPIEDAATQARAVIIARKALLAPRISRGWVADPKPEPAHAV